ncbi:MAG: type IV pilus secretin PilQ [Elusimicrobia bacterium]|nr:type IV pilus secretin PilQ [Elusimicrobiota bacterium]
MNELRFRKTGIVRFCLAWILNLSLLIPAMPVSAEPSTTVSASTATAGGFSILQDVSVENDTVTIVLDKPSPYQVFKVGSPPRLVLELVNTENDWKKKSVILTNNPVYTRIRSGQFQNEPIKIARVVIELKTPVDYKTTTEGNRILLVAQRNGKEESPAPAKKSPPPSQKEEKAAIPETVMPKSEIAPSAPASVLAPAQKMEQEMKPPAPKTNGSSVKETIYDPTDPTSLFGWQTVTLDFFEIDIRELFKILGDKAGVNVVFGNKVSGSVSIQLKDVPFRDAVNTVMTLKSLKIVSIGHNILQVMTTEEFDDYKIKAISMTKVFQINYAKSSDVNTQLVSILATLSGKGKTIVDERTNSIIVTDTPEGIENTAKLIADLDKPTPQVMIEAKIVQVTLGKNLDLGIAWGIAYSDRQGNQMFTLGSAKQSKGDADATAATAGSGAVGLMTRTPLVPGGTGDLEASGAGFTPASGLGLALGFVKDATRLNAALSALAQKNKSKLLSNPKVATLNNQAATIRSQISEPYITTETQLTNAGTLTSQKVNQAISGIALTVTPTINADGRITMKIVPDITSSQPTSIGVPKTTSQQANTTVVVKDGETFVIGGLISELESDSKSYVPFLGRIPLLGHLFKRTGTSKTRAELLVFVTPKIIPY